MQGLEIYDYTGEGYNKTFSFEGWRVANLNYAERFDKGNMKRLERHVETDEVFILLCGSATLYIGEHAQAQELERFKLYNVKKGVWHNVSVSKEARLVIVENHNTAPENTEYMAFPTSPQTI